MNFYTSYAKKQMDCDIDFAADTIKMWFGTSSYTFSAAHQHFGELTNQVSGTNYTADGETLANKTTGLVTVEPCVADADDVVNSQSGAGFTNGRTLVVYKDSGTDNTSWLICRFAAAADFGNVSGALTTQWSASGIIRADLQ